MSTHTVKASIERGEETVELVATIVWLPGCPATRDYPGHRCSAEIVDCRARAGGEHVELSEDERREVIDAWADSIPSREDVEADRADSAYSSGEIP